MCALIASAVLTLLGLGKLVLSNPAIGGGKRFWYFLKRPFSPTGAVESTDSACRAAIVSPLVP